MTYKTFGGYKPIKRKPRHIAKYKSRFAEVIAAMPCGQRAEGDEFACHCGLRWSKSDLRPECPRSKGK